MQRCVYLLSSYLSNYQGSFIHWVYCNILPYSSVGKDYRSVRDVQYECKRAKNYPIISLYHTSVGELITSVAVYKLSNTSPFDSGEAHIYMYRQYTYVHV